MSAGASFHGSSRAPHSIARPQRFSSREYGFAAVVGTGTPCCFAHSISSSRVWRSHSRTGARILSSGSSA